MRAFDTVIALALLVGCKSEGEPDDTGTGTPDTQDTQESSPPEDTDLDELQPTIESCTWQCSASGSGPPQIVVLLEVDDPQGDETIDPMGATLGLYMDTDHLVTTHQLICNDDGGCSGSFGGESAGVPDCDGTQPDLTGIATVADEDGNLSQPCTLTWLG